ncbi:5'-3' exoribonuclease 4 [Cucumispora dikerogammari]|nr:5'-3' exoribonuclease 4 [Cucumispora dikerogammari]
MGITGLFRWLKQKYPSSITDKKPTQTDYLHIDFNALIHISTHPVDEKILTHQEMFALLASNIEKLVKELLPFKVLYLATDGVAPGAKLNQQRQRRYIKAQEDIVKNEEIRKIGKSEVFDINCITPGTVFMNDLKNFVCIFIKQKQTTDEDYKNLEIIYSDDSVPGEGEHKILELIKLTKTDMKHSIYSTDGDLVFLGLSLHKFNIHIIRENIEHINSFRTEHCQSCGKTGHKTEQCSKLRFQKFLYISVTTLRSCFKKEFDLLSKPYVLDNMINDFILVLFLLGNDFLPALPMVDIRSQGIECLEQNLLSIFNGTYLTSENGINFERLQCFMTELAKSENRLYNTKIKILDEVRARIYPNRKYERINLTTEAGKQEYYIKKLRVYNDKQKNEVCISYLKCMAWIYDYYQGRSKNQDFFYPENYAPLAADLCKQNIGHLKFQVSEPVCRLVQLLLILPFSSKNLVPSSFQKIFDDQKLYPKRIIIDMFDKLWDWQGIANIPAISVKEVIKFFENNKCFLTKEETLRSKNYTKALSAKVERPGEPLVSIEDLVDSLKI